MAHTGLAGTRCVCVSRQTRCENSGFRRISVATRGRRAAAGSARAGRARAADAGSFAVARRAATFWDEECVLFARPRIHIVPALPAAGTQRAERRTLACSDQIDCEQRTALSHPRCAGWCWLTVPVLGLAWRPRFCRRRAQTVRLARTDNSGRLSGTGHRGTALSATGVVLSTHRAKDYALDR